MNLHALTTAPSNELAEALAHFEAQFSYPLGPGRSFRISHGNDYAHFFRALGEAVCFVAESEGVVIRTLGAAIRRLLLPGGEERTVLYLGDLKVAPGGRAGRTLVALAQAVSHWALPRVEAAYSVVMDGTRVTPVQYTGRLGIPPFREVGKIAVIRLATTCGAANPGGRWESTNDGGWACFRRLSMGRCAGTGGCAEERSETAPRWLVEPSGAACGRLEDTCKAKRLIANDGVELRSAHLSCFAYRDPLAGVDLIRTALSRAAERGFPALLVAVDASDADELRRSWTESEIVIAPATVYGSGLKPGSQWNINTAEI